MRILVLSTFDNKGGAAKAAYRFSKEFKRQGNDVCMYVSEKTTNSNFVLESSKSDALRRIDHLLDFGLGYILSGLNKECPFTLGVFGENLSKIVGEFKPDVINVHWTWKGFVSFIEICRISKKVPVVWTMHDSSPFNRGLFYPWRSKYPLVNLLSYFNSFLRRIFLKNSNIKFVSPSDFLLTKFNSTHIGQRYEVLAINNGVDVSIYKPKDKVVEKEKWGLDIKRKYLLFGAVNLVKDPIKGGVLLKRSLKEIEDYLIKENIGLLSYGSQDLFKDLNLSEDIEKKHLGFIQSDIDMASILSCGNVVLVPSLFENYPFAVLEPLACKIPVVALNVGGIPELVRHRKNGYLAHEEVYEDFAKGIKFCLNNEMKFTSMELSIQNKAQDYANLFENSIKAGIS